MDESSWIHGRIPALNVDLEQSGNRVMLHVERHIPVDDCIFTLCCSKMIPDEILLRNAHNVMVHEHAFGGMWAITARDLGAGREEQDFGPCLHGSAGRGQTLSTRDRDICRNGASEQVARETGRVHDPCVPPFTGLERIEIPVLRAVPVASNSTCFKQRVNSRYLVYCDICRRDVTNLVVVSSQPIMSVGTRKLL